MTKNTKMRDDIALDDLADILKMHPRTIMRKLPGNDVNAYWAKGYNPSISISDLAEGFGEDPVFFVPVINSARRKKDEIMDPKTMAKFLDVPLRTFRHRKYSALIRQGNIVRYSRFDTTNYNIEKFVK